MLTGTVHTRIRLLVKQTAHIMLIGNALHCFHDKLVVIDSNVRRLVDRR